MEDKGRLVQGGTPGLMRRMALNELRHAICQAYWCRGQLVLR